ncbi:hypothetical protein [Thiobacillus sp.]
MKTLKSLIGTFLIVCFAAKLAGCEQSGSKENGGQAGHGHSHE